MLDTPITGHAKHYNPDGTPSQHFQRAPWARPAVRKFGCSAQTFCPECRLGNHAHPDAYGRPEYHCPSSRPWVGWQRVYFGPSGVVSCSCEHGKVQAERGLPSRCAGHALYTLYKIESGDWPSPEELGGSYPFVISVCGGELFEDEGGTDYAA